MERWAAMPTVYGMEERAHKLQIGQRVYDIPVLILDQEGIDRLRLGYICIACMERHEVPWPEECAQEACRFPMRAHQAEVFERLFQGWHRIGPLSDLDDERERMIEDYQRMKRAKEKNRPSIWLPGDG